VSRDLQAARLRSEDHVCRLEAHRAVLVAVTEGVIVGFVDAELQPQEDVGSYRLPASTATSGN